MQRRKRLVHDLVRNRRKRVSTERLSPREALVKTNAEGEDIGAAVDGSAANLLGSHVIRCAQKLARSREISA